MRQGKYKYVGGRFIHVEDVPSPFQWFVYAGILATVAWIGYHLFLGR